MSKSAEDIEERYGPPIQRGQLRKGMLVVACMYHDEGGRRNYIGNDDVPDAFNMGTLLGVVAVRKVGASHFVLQPHRRHELHSGVIVPYEPTPTRDGGQVGYDVHLVGTVREMREQDAVDLLHNMAQMSTTEAALAMRAWESSKR